MFDSSTESLLNKSNLIIKLPNSNFKVNNKNIKFMSKGTTN